jgi:glucan phosphoethanolaminetransferase (alkaline phosphatase superfamily)
MRRLANATRFVSGHPLAAALLLAVLSTAVHATYEFQDTLPLAVLRSGGWARFLAALSVSWLQSFAVSWLIVRPPKWARVVLVPVLVTVVVVQLTFFLALKNYMLSTDWLMALTVGGEHVRGAILSFFDPRAFLMAIPFAALYIGVAWLPSIRWTRRTGLAVVASLSFLLVTNYIFYLRVDEKQFVVDPVTCLVRSAFSYEFRQMFEYHGPRDEVPKIAVERPPRGTVIYIIDESVRGSNLSINGYPRETTPYLRSLVAGGQATNFGICAALSVYSHVSNAYLVSGASDMPDREFRTAKNPTLFDFAKALGYKTLYLDVNHGWLSTHTDEQGSATIRSVDRWLRESWVEKAGLDLKGRKDMAVVDILLDTLAKDEGTFVLVVKSGLHFPYGIRFPDAPEHRIWEPVMGPNDPIDPSPAGREKLVNAFDDGIRYQVDDFFHELLTRAKNQNFVVVYTSDHGQTLSENGQRYTHAKPDKVIVDVPCFIVEGSAYEKSGLVRSAKPGIRVSHLNLFASVLDLLGAPQSMRARPYPKSIFELTTEDNKVRPYLTGSLNGDSRGIGAQYGIGKITDPPTPGWGVSTPPPYAPPLPR